MQASSPAKTARTFQNGDKVDERELSKRAAAGLAVTRKAGALALDYHRRPDALRIEHKGTQDYVSAADKACEELIVGDLSRAFPGDAFLGEEGGRRGSADVTWIIDPIDGTSNFVRGIPFWCISVGLVVGREPVLGYIYDPVRDEMFAGVKGKGATLNGAPIRVTGQTELSEARLCLGFSYRRPVAPHARDVRALLDEHVEYSRLGSGALGSVYVAAGRFDGYWERHINAWDVAAAVAIVRGAGGRTNDFFAGDGMESGNEILAATPALYDRFHALLNTAA
jgi:myo-inositol-1(or 4)-monophosphatase